MQANLLKGTIQILENYGKTLTDVEWIGTSGYEITFEQFITLADVEYDAGYGAQKVATDLLVVGNGWWLERHEYDGSEWWEYKECPKRPAEIREVKRLVGGMWNTLEELQED